MSAVAATAASAETIVPIRLTPEPDGCILLDDIDWSAYEAIGEALLNRANIRLTYDRGRLEIMTLSAEHERLRVLFGYLVQVLAEEADVVIGGFGSTTYKRDVLERGLEPDQCYYHQSLPRVRGLRRIDLSRDPPPDLAVEIDVTHSSLNRMGIYEQLGVPELWRLRNDVLQIYQIGADGRYAPIEVSPTFPTIPIGELVRFLVIGMAQDDTSMIRACRAWARERLAQS